MTMSATVQHAVGQHPREDWKATLRSTYDLIAPVWPLDEWIAVNPFWGLKHLPASWADHVLSRRGGGSLLMPPAFYREAWAGGRIRQEDLEASVQEQQAPETPAQLVGWLDYASVVEPEYRGSVMMTYPPTREGEQVLDRVRDQVAATCAAFFDRRQSRWTSAPEAENLFVYWLESSRADLSLDSVSGIAGARKVLRAVPDDLQQAVEEAVREIGIGGEALEALAHFWLLQVNGWSAWCRGEDWRAGLEGRTSDRLWELLAIALVWEQTGLRCCDPAGKAAWLRQRNAGGRVQASGQSSRLWLWHRAYEIGYQRVLWRALAKAPGQDTTTAPEVQAVFCIDVRSEVLRRHLETVYPQMQTLGFAGFFGLPIEHQTHGPVRPVRRLPGLLKAPYRWVDSLGSLSEDHRQSRRLNQREITRSSVRGAKYGSLSTFTLVETSGLAWAWKLVRDSLKRTPAKSDNEPSDGRLVHALGGDPLTDAEKADLVAGMLKGMSLTRGFAPLLVFVGHGSHADNNPHQAGLGCGACGGQGGATNARLAATLFNDPQVRAALAARGIRIPDYTWALAAEHCTLTDEFRLFGVDTVPDSHRSRLDACQSAFERAGRAVRRERATPLGLQGLSDECLAEKVTERGRDWSEVRPEWGLAGNAALLVAPRWRSRGCHLGGRVFLHEYEPGADADGSVLEALLSAPMVVANWINLQYFASVTAPGVNGAGNKLLHSVVGGNVGVIEGNSPQLRIGLPLQSVHDGVYWRHEPVRLTVVIDAPAERIESVLRHQREVAELVENQWLFLCRFSSAGIEQYRDGHWQRVAAQA